MEKQRVRRLYAADYLITPDRVIPNGAVLCENERIIGVGGQSGFSVEPEIELYHFKNAYIAPGFLDTHIHGAGGCDCSRCVSSPRDLAAMSKILGERGVTGFFPTVVADTKEVMLENLQQLSQAMRAPLPGADAIAINYTDGNGLLGGKIGLGGIHSSNSCQLLLYKLLKCLAGFVYIHHYSPPSLV